MCEASLLKVINSVVRSGPQDLAPSGGRGGFACYRVLAPSVGAQARRTGTAPWKFPTPPLRGGDPSHRVPPGTYRREPRRAPACSSCAFVVAALPPPAYSPFGGDKGTNEGRVARVRAGVGRVERECMRGGGLIEVPRGCAPARRSARGRVACRSSAWFCRFGVQGRVAALGG